MHRETVQPGYSIKEEHPELFGAMNAPSSQHMVKARKKPSWGAKDDSFYAIGA
jgi:hypothetical protein